LIRRCPCQVMLERRCGSGHNTHAITIRLNRITSWSK
jgi:hypothetical protein